jgi:hypothetical protein
MFVGAPFFVPTQNELSLCIGYMWGHVFAVPAFPKKNRESRSEKGNED